MVDKFLQAGVISFLLNGCLVAAGDEAKLASTPLTASVNGVTLPVSSTTELREWDRVGALILQQPQPGSLAWAQPLVDTRIPCFRGLDDEKLF